MTGAPEIARRHKALSGPRTLRPRFDGLLEVVGGVLLLLVSKAQLDAWVVALTQHELSEERRLPRLAAP